MSSSVRAINEWSWDMRVLTAMLVMLLVAVPGISQAFHFPWDQGHDTTDWNDPDNPGPPDQPPCDPCSGRATKSPVYVTSGHLVWMESDVTIPGRPGLALARTFNSNDPRDGMFGRGWSSNVETALLQFAGSELDPQGSATETAGYVLRLGTGKRYTYADNGDGTFNAPASRFERIVRNADGSAALVGLDGASKTFNAQGRITAQATAGGHTLGYDYSADGRLTRITDAAGRYLRFAYNTGGRVESVTDSANRTWHYAYDSNGNLTSIIDPSGAARSFEYRQYTPAGDGNTYSQLTKITDATNVVVIEVAYVDERVATYTEGQNRYSYTYNTVARTVTKTDLLGSQWTYNYDDNGLVVSERDPLGGIELYEFDVNGSVTRYTDQLGEQWQSTFDAQGRMTSATNPATERTTYEYPGNLPYPSRIVSPSGRTTQITYDARANPIQMLDPAQAPTDFTWNAAGNLQQIRNALGNSTTFTAEATGLPLTITDPLTRTSVMSYDTAGQMVSMVNADNETTHFEYDARGLPTATVLPSGRRTSYARDAAGRVTGVTDPSGRTTSFEYDSFGRLSARVMSDGRRYTFQYRNDNLLSQVSRPDGVAVTFTYDSAKRLTREQAGADAISYTYNARHQMLSASNLTGTISHSYDNVGRMQSETANGQVVTYTYNSESESTGFASIAGTVQLQRDGRGLLTGIAAPEGQYAFQYDALTRRTRLTYPNGTQANYQYDAANQLQQLAYSGAFTETFGHQYTSDGLLQHLVTGTVTWDYGYNGDNQLTSATNGAQSFNYQYDLADNLTDQGRTHDAGNRLTQDNAYSYTYDLLGNLTQKTARATGARTVYSWDSWNRLIRVERFSAGATVPSETMAYTYDAMGRRLTRTVNGAFERFVYDALNRIATLGTSGNVIHRVTFGPDIDEPLGLQGSQGASFLHANYLGSVVAVSNSTQSQGRYDYEPYGAAIGTAPPINNPFRYTGREFEADDLYYYRARYYDPQMSRFVSEDPIGLSGGANVYAYVGGNPIALTDPFGLEPRGGERGATGGAGGQNTDNPYKHCREFNPPQQGFVECRHHQTGKWIRKPRPPEMPFPEPAKSEMCGESCRDAAITVAVAGGATVAVVGGSYFAYRCIRMIPSVAIPALWPTIPANALLP